MGVVIIKKGDSTRVSQYYLWLISKENKKQSFKDWLESYEKKTFIKLEHEENID